MRVAAFALALAVFTAACRDQRYRPLVVGDRVPEYGARSLDGDSVALTELRGAPVLLNVWATYCVPCRTEMPELEELYAEYGDRVRFVGVSIDAPGSDGEVRRFLEEVGATFEIWRDPQERVVRRFTLLGVPETFLIDAEGVVRHRWTGRFRPLEPENVARVEAVLE